MKSPEMKFFYSLIIFLLMLIIAAPVPGAEVPLVVVINSNKAAAYQQTMQSFKTSLRQSRPEVEFIQFDSAAGIDDMEDASLIFALGSRAINDSQTELGDRELLATMILSTKALANTSHATAILLKTPILKQLQWHRRFLPDVKRVGILYNPRHNQEWVDAARIAAAELGLKIIAIPVKSGKDLPSALKQLSRSADSILGIADKTVYSGKTAKAVLLFSFRNRIPFVGLSSAWVKAGALYALDWDYPALGQQCAAVALRIINGEKAAMIQPQLSDKQVYLINLKTAKQMKLDISRELIDGASKVYE